MSTGNIRAVLFDLGETLIDFGKVDRTRVFWQGARRSYDFLKGQRQPVGCFALYFMENLVHLRWQNLRSHWTCRDFDVLELFERVGTRKGICLQPAEWEQVAWLWYQPLAEVATTEPGLPGTLARLKDLGLKLGILSNTFVPASSLDKHLAQAGLLEFFPLRLYSYQYRFRKPDPEIFRLAAECLDEPVEHILYVGDRIDLDIQPALAVGMQAALKTAYTNAGKHPPAGARTIEHMAELPGLIEAISMTLKKRDLPSQ